MNCWYCHQKMKSSLLFPSCSICKCSYLIGGNGGVHSVYIYGENNNYLWIIPDLGCSLYKRSAPGAPYKLVYRLKHIPEIDSSNVRAIADRLLNLAAFS